MGKEHPIGPAARRLGRALAGVARAAAKEATRTPPTIPVSRAELEARGRRWPLTIDHGHVVADRGGVYFRAPDGTTYALTGSARGDHQDIAPIHREDETIAQAMRDAGDAHATVPKVPLTELIRIGRQARQ